MNVSREHRSKRMIQRVTAPLWVTIDGHAWPANDWSLGGFGVVCDTTMPRGLQIEARLAFPIGSTELGFTAPAEVVYAGADGRHGFRFLDLEPDQTELLRQMWVATTTGQVLPLDACLTLADPPEPMPPPSGVAPRSPGRLVGYGLLLALGLLVVTAAAVGFHARLLVVRADSAAVTVPVVRLRAPVAGPLGGSVLTPGAPAPPGAPLFDLAGPELAAEIDLAEAELARVAATVQALRRRRDEMRTFFGDYRDLAESALRRVQSDRLRADTELELAERDLSRWEDLAKDGFAAQARVDQAKQRYARAEHELSSAEAAVDLANANVRMAQQGRWFSGSRVEGAEPAKLDDDIRQAEGTHDLQARRLATLLEQRAARVVSSPCDCVIVQVLAAADEWVAAGAVVALLRPRGEAAGLSARVAQDKVDLLSVGDRATVRLAGARHPSEAITLAVTRAPLAEPRLGLPDTLDRDGATVTLHLPADAVPEPAAGTPAQVLFVIPPRRLLLSWLGWSW
jgi:multidrug resistance efflux pump